jgi:excisionase family DNA binding protein
MLLFVPWMMEFPRMSQLSTDREEKPAQAGIAPLAVAPIEGARLLSVCVKTVYNLMQAGELDSFKSGKARRIPMASIRRYVARQLAATKRGRKRQQASRERE